MGKKGIDKLENGFEWFIFWSRWIQAPIYGGLVVGSILFCYKFIEQTIYMCMHVHEYSDSLLIIGILTLVDIIMVCNVLIMVIIGGYATFVSKLNIGKHEDRPAWLKSMDPGTLKVKLSASLVGVSGIHLLKSFMYISVSDAELAAAGKEVHITSTDLMWQSIIHCVFLFSAIGLAYSEKVLHQAHKIEHDNDTGDEHEGRGKMAEPKG